MSIITPKCSVDRISFVNNPENHVQLITTIYTLLVYN